MSPKSDAEERELDLLEYADPPFIAALNHYVGIRHMSWTELAQRLGVSRATMTNWRTNKNTPPSAMVLDMCTVLEVVRSEFFKTGERLVAEHRTKRTKDLEDVLERVKALTDEDIEAAGIDPAQRRKYVDGVEKLLQFLKPSSARK